MAASAPAEPDSGNGATMTSKSAAAAAAAKGKELESLEMSEPPAELMVPIPPGVLSVMMASQRLRDEPVVCVRIEREMTLQKPLVVTSEDPPST